MIAKLSCALLTTLHRARAPTPTAPRRAPASDPGIASVDSSPISAIDEQHVDQREARLVPRRRPLLCALIVFAPFIG